MLTIIAYLWPGRSIAGTFTRTTKKPGPLRDRAFSVFGVAVTYFRMRMHTIIGANPFHGPVRDGKEWFQAAIAAT